MPRRIRVSSTALGEKCSVTVMIYDDQASMHAAATAYNGGKHDADVWGVTQAEVGSESGRAYSVIVRLTRERLGTEVICHEMHHAATALYGSRVGNRLSRRAHLNHYNEPFAYLFSDLHSRLVRRLYALGYYDSCDD